MILKPKEKNLAYETPDRSWYFQTSTKEGYSKQLINFNTKIGWTETETKIETEVNNNGNNNSDEPLPTTDENIFFSTEEGWKETET